MQEWEKAKSWQDIHGPPPRPLSACPSPLQGTPGLQEIPSLGQRGTEQPDKPTDPDLFPAVGRSHLPGVGLLASVVGGGWSVQSQAWKLFHGFGKRCSLPPGVNEEAHPVFCREPSTPMLNTDRESLGNFRDRGRALIKLHLNLVVSERSLV